MMFRPHVADQHEVRDFTCTTSVLSGVSVQGFQGFSRAFKDRYEFRPGLMGTFKGFYIQTEKSEGKY